MKTRQCDREDTVLRAARLDVWGDELRLHAMGCRNCTDAVLAARFMKMEAGRASPADRPLPDPGRIYWRAQLLARREAAARAARPIAFVERAAIACALVASAFALAWGLPILLGWLTTLTSAVAAGGAPAGAPPGPALGLGVVLCLGTLPVLLVLAVLNAARTSE